MGINSYILQVASLTSLAQLLPPRSSTVRNPADSSLCRLQSCSPIVSSPAAARRLRPPGPIAASASTAAPPLPPLPAAVPPLHLLLAACIRFSCCSRSRPLRLLLPDCVRFNCCSPITSASTAAPRLRLLNSSPCPDPNFSNILRGVRG